MFGYKQHPAPIQIVDQGEVVVPFGKRLLIDTQTLDGLGLTTRQTSFHGPLLNRMHFVPTQAELLGHGLLAGGLEPIDGEPFKQSREPATEKQGKKGIVRITSDERLGVRECL